MPTIPIGEDQLHYEAQGDGPVLLMAPGLNGLGSFWARQVPELARDFRVIVYDHRGTGRSTHSGLDYTVEQMANDVLRLMDALEIGAAHFVGHSTGGAIGQIIAQDHRDRLSSLVLSASWPGRDAYFRRCFESRRDVLAALGLVAYLRASALVLYPPWWISTNDALLAEQHRQAILASPRNEVLSSRIDAILEFDRRHRLKDISTPTLVVVAADDALTPRFYSEELARGIHGAELTVLDTGGHFAPVVVPEAYTRAVAHFIRRQIGQ